MPDASEGVVRKDAAMPLRVNGRAASLISVLVLFAVPAFAQVSVLTQHNDNARSGANTSEIVLTAANVAGGNFGKLFTRTLDADVNGEVLYVPNLTINGAVHNVIIAYTSDNSDHSPCSLYAFDADQPTVTDALWRHQFTNSAQWTTCTPVIDSSTNTIYVVTKDNDDNGVTNLRAINLLTGVEKTGSPVTVAATVNGTGDGSSGGHVSFDTTHANCRPALLFANSSVYIAFAHNSDSFPYHGWIFRYTYNGTSFTKANVFCVNPNGGLDGIWMAGNGLVADGSGDIYTTTGNGTFDINTGGTSYGMSVLKLSSTLGVVDYFTPWDEAGNSNADLDFGNCGVLIVPGTSRLFTGGTKFGSAFLLDSSSMGHFTSGGPDNVLNRMDSISSDDNVGQNPVAWDSGTYKYAYLWPGGTGVKQFRYDTGVAKLNPNGVYKSYGSSTSGGSLAVSSQGTSNGILWAVGSNAVVHALTATDVSLADLWKSSTNSGRDGLGSTGHFQFPMVANGRVYVPTGSGSIVVYGLLTTTTTPVISPASGPFTGSQSVSITDSTSGAVIYYTTDGSTPYPGQGSTLQYTTSFNVNATTTVKAVAFSSSSEPSAVASQTYTQQAAASATFVKTDTSTQGNWKGVYGGDGWNVLMDTSANNPTYPGYATVTPGTHTTGVWAAGSLLPNCLQKPAAGSAIRTAGVWYQKSWSMNVSVTGTHQLALYLLDFNNAGYAETITIKDTSSGTVLDTRSASNFNGGVYLVWNVSGNVTVTFTGAAGGWGVLSGVFFGGGGSTAPTQPAGLSAALSSNGSGIGLTWTASTGATSYNVYRGFTAGGESTTDPIATGVVGTSYHDTTGDRSTTYYYKVVGVNSVGGSFASNEAHATNLAAVVLFVRTDTTTQGTWKGHYGSDGFNVIGDTSSVNPVYPSYATVTPGAHNSGLWVASTHAVNCLQKVHTPTGDRIAGVWFQTSWSMTVDLTQKHTLALYLLDYPNSGYAETITIKDAATGTVLDTESASSFNGGKYYVWTVQGTATITFTSTAGHWAVLSGIFFSP